MTPRRVPQGASRSEGIDLRQVPRGHPQGDRHPAAARPRGRLARHRERRRGRRIPRVAGTRRPAATSSTGSRTSSCSCPEQASPEQIDAKRRRAEEALKQVRDGTDFAQVAAGFSDAPDALQGGGLGLAHAGAAADACSSSPVRVMKPGDVVGGAALGDRAFTSSSCRRRAAATRRRSSSRRARGTSSIKVNEVVSEAEAKARDRSHPRPPRDRRQVRGPGEAQFGGRERRRRAAISAGSRPATRCRISRRAMDEAQDRRDVAAGAHAVRLAPDPGRRSAARRTSPRERKRDQARHGAAPAQVGRGVPGLAAPAARQRLRRDSSRSRTRF